MNLIVLGNRTGWHTQQLVAAGQSLGWRVTPRSYSELMATVTHAEFANPWAAVFEDVNGILLRGMGPSSLQQIVFRMDVLEAMRLTGINIINQPRCIECSIDKFLSFARLKQRGLPVVETLVVQLDATHRLVNEDVVISFFKRHRSVILKPLFGSEGRGLEKFDRFDDFRRFHQDVEQGIHSDSHRLQELHGGVYYLQQFVEHQFDLRCLVVGDRVFSVKRENRDHWVTNVSQGGVCCPYRATEEEETLARAASAAMGARVAGVDLMHTGAGPVIIEVNACPGWKGLQSVVEESIARNIVQLFKCDTDPIHNESVNAS